VINLIDSRNTELAFLILIYILLFIIAIYYPGRPTIYVWTANICPEFFFQALCSSLSLYTILKV
jgi:hypothetical protein